MIYYFFSLVPKEILEAFDRIFNASFFKIQNAEQNFKKR